MRQDRLILSGVLLLMLAACQSDTGRGPVSASLEDVYVYSNDPDRVGAAHFTRGNYALAERYFRDAVERKQGDIDSWVGLAASYDQLKRFDLADRAYAQALALNGASVPLLNNYGYSLMLRGRLKEADSRFRQALALAPQNQYVLNNIALLQRVRGKYRR